MKTNGTISKLLHSLEVLTSGRKPITIIECFHAWLTQQNWDKTGEYMTKGMDLGTLTSELEYMLENHRDFLVSTETLAVSLVDGNPRLTFRDTNDKLWEFGLTRHALGQIFNEADLVPSERAVKVLLDYGSERERKALLQYANVVLEEENVCKGIRTVGRFWQEPKAVGFVPAKFQTESHMSVLTHFLHVAGLMGLRYVDGDLTDEGMTVVFGNPRLIGFTLTHSNVLAPSGIMWNYGLDDGTFISIPTGQFYEISGHWTDVTINMLKFAQETLSVSGIIDRFNYLESDSAKFRDDYDPKIQLVAMGLTSDEARIITKHFNKGERTQATLIRAIAKYAHNSKGTLENQIVLERIAGSLIATDLDALERERQNNGKAKTPKRKAVKASKSTATGTPAPAERATA